MKKSKLLLPLLLLLFIVFSVSSYVHAAPLSTSGTHGKSFIIAQPGVGASRAAQSLRSTLDPGRIGETLTEEAGAETTPLQYAPTLQIPEIKSLDSKAQQLKFKITDIHIENPIIYSSEELIAPFRHYFHQTITLAELQKIAECMTKRYQQAGYVLTQVILPPQKIQNGRVTLKVIAGHIDKIEFSGNISEEMKCYLLQFAEHIKNSYPLQMKTLEHYTELANDTPGLTINSVLKPSKTTPGASDLVFKVEPKLHSAYASVNNFGTRFLGPRQYLLGVDESSFFQVGDGTQVQAVTTGNAELNYAQIRHTLPMNDEGLRFGGFGRYVRTEPGSILVPFEAKGNSASCGTDFTYPFIRSRKENLTLLSGFILLDSKSNFMESQIYNDRIRPIYATLLYNRIDSLKGFNRADLSLTQGLKILNASGSRLVSRPGGKSKFTKINAGFSRSQPLPHQFSFLISILGQYSFQHLLAISQFGFGGPELGRGYDPSEILGDKGIAGSIELRYDGISTSKIVPWAQYFVFYDAGKVWHTDPLIKKDSATSTGIGVRLEITKHGRANFFIAKPLTRKVLSTNNKNIRAFFSLTLMTA